MLTFLIDIVLSPPFFYIREEHFCLSIIEAHSPFERYALYTLS